LIFVTVGSQLSFDRLIRLVDDWAGLNPDEQIIVQSGETAFVPRHCRKIPFMENDEWEDLFQRADRIIAHAGMGTILKSLVYGKPLMIAPRRAELGEVCNDHQCATAARFHNERNIWVINDARELAAALADTECGVTCCAAETNPNLDRLLSELKRFAHACD